MRERGLFSNVGSFAENFLGSPFPIMSKAKFFLIVVAVACAASVSAVLVQHYVFGKVQPWVGGLAGGLAAGLAGAFYRSKLSGRTRDPS